MSNDKFFMRKSCELALKAKGKTFPNPLVGCVIVDNRSGEQKIIAEGFHARAGEKHAERAAIFQYEEEFGELPPGLDLYVNLEPCSHYGRTPPCADLIIEKKFARVFIGMSDPNPLVNGRGIQKLRDAGIEVIEGVEEKAAEFLNRIFIKNISRGSCYFTLKVACTLDGLMADEGSHSKWITNQQSRSYVHQLRQETQGLITGIKTILIDNPSLNIRLGEAAVVKNKIIILDKDFLIEGNAQVFQANDPDNITIVVSTQTYESFPQNPERSSKYHSLKTQGTQFMVVATNDQGHFVPELSHHLYRRGFCHLLVEAGPNLVSSFIQEDLADELFIFLAPKLLGHGRPHLSFTKSLDLVGIPQAKNLELINVKEFGQDVCLNYLFTEIKK
jgi:diaminohydroxyphosphoribosylaminopyrimidine deaminase/5-amino-6-(5-phosphoribosylamino)uracil reductase